MEHEFKIKIFGNDEKLLKLLGEILSNSTSRKIIRVLIEKESYTNEIATILKIRVSLVIHHLKKLENLGLLEITEKQIVRKGNKHRYFKMNPYFLVAPNDSEECILRHGIGRFYFNSL